MFGHIKNVFFAFLVSSILLFCDSVFACTIPKGLDSDSIISESSAASQGYTEECNIPAIAPIDCGYCKIDTITNGNQSNLLCRIYKKCLSYKNDDPTDECLSYEYKLSEGCAQALFQKENKLNSNNKRCVPISNSGENGCVEPINNSCADLAKATGKCYQEYRTSGFQRYPDGRIIGCTPCVERPPSDLEFTNPEKTVGGGTAYWVGDCGGKGVFADNPNDIFPSKTGCYNPEERFVKYYNETLNGSSYSRTNLSKASYKIPREDVLNLDKVCATPLLSTFGNRTIFKRSIGDSDSDVIQCMRPSIADRIDEEENFLNYYLGDANNYFDNDIILEKKPDSDKTCRRVVKTQRLVNPFAAKPCEITFGDDFDPYPPLNERVGSTDLTTQYLMQERYLPPSLVNDKDERILATPYSRKLDGNQLGEYGYGDNIIERTDYPFNKYDVYGVTNGDAKASASKPECFGTKMRRQAALKLFIEEYAHQTDCNGERGINLNDTSIYDQSYCQFFVHQNQADDMGDLGLTQMVFGRVLTIRPEQTGLRSEAFDMLNFATQSELFVLPDFGIGKSQDICKKKISGGGLGTFTDGVSLDFKRRGCPESYPVNSATWPEFFKMESCDWSKGSKLINNPYNATAAALKLAYKIIGTATTIMDLSNLASGVAKGPGGIFTAIGATTGNPALDNLVAGFLIDTMSGKDPVSSLFDNLMGPGRLIDISGLPFVAQAFIDAGVNAIKTGKFDLDLTTIFAAALNDLGGIDGILENTGLKEIAGNVTGFFNGIDNFFKDIDKSITNTLFGKGGLVSCDSGGGGVGGNMLCGVTKGIVGGIKDFVFNMANSQVQNILNQATGGIFGDINKYIGMFNDIQNKRLSMIQSKCSKDSKNVSCKIYIDSAGGVNSVDTKGGSINPFDIQIASVVAKVAGVEAGKQPSSFKTNSTGNPFENLPPSNTTGKPFTLPLLTPLPDESAGLQVGPALKGFSKGMEEVGKAVNGILDGLIAQVMNQAGSLFLTTKIDDFRSMLWPPLTGVGILGQAFVGIPIILVDPTKAVKNVERRGWVDSSWPAGSCTMTPLVNMDKNWGDYFGITPDYSPFRDCVMQGCEVKGFQWHKNGNTLYDFKLNWLISQEAMWCEFELPFDPYSGNFAERAFEKHNPFTINKPRGSSPLKFGQVDKNIAGWAGGFIQVERIRDACGAFSQRGSWFYDTKRELSKWLVGDDKARCQDWVGAWGTKYDQTKVSSWRLERFDYEFLKSFIECTGPVKDVGPNPCKGINFAQVIYNSCGICFPVPGKYGDPKTYAARLPACIASALAIAAASSVNKVGVFAKAACAAPTIICNETCPFADDATGVDKNFWKENRDEKATKGGFWCTCPNDNAITTMCREDNCTCQQLDLVSMGKHKLYTKVGTDIPLALSNIGPLVCDNYGPYRRWLQCYHVARSRACPVLTRDISMTPPNESLLFPPYEQTDAQKEAQKKQFCEGSEIPTPPQLNVRWQLEEPNFLARLNVADDPGGLVKEKITVDEQGKETIETGNFYAKNSDLVFLSQVKDAGAPYLEPALPLALPTSDADDKLQKSGGQIAGAYSSISSSFRNTDASKLSNDKKTLYPNPRALEAVVGPRGCDIGGWYEMMLYQARCIQKFGLGCICDYDKTFVLGSAEKYVLSRAGAKFSYYETDPITGDDRLVGRKPIEFPLMWRGNAGPDFAVGAYPPSRLWDKTGKTILKKDSGNTYKREQPTTYRDSDYQGLFGSGDNGAKEGDILIWDETVLDDKGEDARYRRHVAFVERVGSDKFAGVNDAPTYPYVEVSEMNWGKYQDSCGNTDRWGIPTNRKIYKTPIMELKTGGCTNNPGLEGENCFELYKMPCDNPDNAICYEHNHQRVKIYRPSLDKNTPTAYPICKQGSPDPKEIANGVKVFGAEIKDYVNANLGKCDPTLYDRADYPGNNVDFTVQREVSSPLLPHCAGQDGLGDGGIGCPKYKTLNTAVISTYNWILPSIPFSLNGNLMDMLKMLCQLTGLKNECAVLDCATAAVSGSGTDKYKACEKLCDSNPNLPIVKEACSAFQCYKSAKTCTDSNSSCNLDVYKCCSLPGLIDVPQCCDYLNMFGSLIECARNPSAKCCEIYPDASETCKNLLGCVGLDNFKPTPVDKKTDSNFTPDIQDPIRSPYGYGDFASASKLEKSLGIGTTLSSVNSNKAKLSGVEIKLEPSKCCKLFPGNIACAAYECLKKPDYSCCSTILSGLQTAGVSLPSELTGLISQCGKIAQCINSFNRIENPSSTPSPPSLPTVATAGLSYFTPSPPPNNFPRDWQDVPPLPTDPKQPKSSQITAIANSCCGISNSVGIDDSRLCQAASCYTDYQNTGQISTDCCNIVPEIPYCADVISCINKPDITCCDNLVSKIDATSALGLSCSAIKSCVDSVNGGKFVDASCCSLLPSNLQSASKCNLLLQCQIDIRKCQEDLDKKKTTGINPNCKSCCDSILSEFGATKYVPECDYTGGGGIDFGNLKIEDIYLFQTVNIGQINTKDLRNLQDLQKVLFDVFKKELDKLLANFGGINLGVGKAPCQKNP